MRDHKYKAWHKVEKVMCDVSVINFDQGAFLIGVKKGEDEIGDKYFVPAPTDGRFCNFDEFELLEYTGLKDKNGKEIYEGDLLNEIRYPPDKNGNYDSVPVFIKENIVQVGFNEGCFTADEAHLWRFISNIGDNEKTDYEIIGNIYENSELLTLTK